MDYIGPFIVLMMEEMSKGKSSSYEMHYLLC
jgi:hypothetical protein